MVFCQTYSLKLPKKTEATKKLLKSRTLFNFSTNYYYNNASIATEIAADFEDLVFKQFVTYLKSDTTFVTKQESLFETAYKASLSKNISKEYEIIQQKLFEDKIAEISKNKDLLKNALKEEILKRYYYQEGVYKYKLKNDLAVLEALNLLNNQDHYNALLSGEK